MQTTEYQRKSFSVRAVQLTDENFNEIAAWTRANVKMVSEYNHPHHEYGKKYLEVPVTGGFRAHPRKSNAYVGDWIVTRVDGHMVYRDKHFREVFETAEESASSGSGDPMTDPMAHARNTLIEQIVWHAMMAQEKATYYQDGLGDMPLVARQAADEIVRLFTQPGYVLEKANNPVDPRWAKLLEQTNAISPEIMNQLH